MEIRFNHVSGLASCSPVLKLSLEWGSFYTNPWFLSSWIRLLIDETSLNYFDQIGDFLICEIISRTYKTEFVQIVIKLIQWHWTSLLFNNIHVDSHIKKKHFISAVVLETDIVVAIIVFNDHYTISIII